VPHLARDVAVATADRIRSAAHAEPELRNAEGLDRIVRALAPQSDDPFRIDTKFADHAVQRAHDVRGLERLVPAAIGVCVVKTVR
jgi:hypothetical protein